MTAYTVRFLTACFTGAVGGLWLHLYFRSDPMSRYWWRICLAVVMVGMSVGGFVNASDRQPATTVYIVRSAP